MKANFKNELLPSTRETSNLKDCKEQLQQAHPKLRNKSERKIALQKRRIQEEGIQTVSFDVFDTLVCRTVLRPVDVFELIQARLYETHLEILGENFISSFASSRHGIERLIRTSLDAQNNQTSEEMKIADIYKIMLEDHGLSPDLIDELIMIEQELELACIIPRHEGIELYSSALSAGKRVIIISDFIHPTSFVERVLLKCGIDSWEKIYVSSDIGLKKHSGALFAYVKNDLNLTSAKTLHIGDNRRGDIKMAKKNGWQTQHLPSCPSLIRTQIKKKNIDKKIINKSFVNRVIFSALANEFYSSRNVNPLFMRFIENTTELGFVTLGPMMHFFSRWLVDEAQKNNCTQIAFFARDSVLPYHMVNKILQQEGAPDIKTCYLPVSRAAVSGLDIKSPQDLYKVRIDDFKKSKFLMELFECRFHLEPHEIDEGIVLKWTNKSIHKVKVGDIPVYAIYQIARLSAQNNWDVYSKNISKKRSLFERVLKQWGCDINKKTLTVDFGYKGSIHRKIEHFFTEPPLPRFFISYANALGRPPLPNVKAFFLSNQIPDYKTSSPLIQYNLLIETIINEGTGSALGYHDVDGHIEVLREDSIDEEHTRIIKELHQGALQFSDYWIRNCQPIDNYTSIEPQMLSYILQKILFKPTAEIANILGNLKFDNGYSRKKTKKMICMKPLNKSIRGLCKYILTQIIR
jgi:predicted HAD superfamily hydrolase